MWRRGFQLLAELAAGGDVGLWSVCLTAAFQMLFSVGQSCNVNTNEMEPCLLKETVGWGGEDCVNPTSHPL